MSTMMADPTQQIPPESGWIAATILALGALLKGLWPWLKQREDRAHKLTAAERAKQAEEERDLVLTLKATVNKHEDKIKALEERLETSLETIIALTTDKAELTVKLDVERAARQAADAEVARLRERLAIYETNP